MIDVTLQCTTEQHLVPIVQWWCLVDAGLKLKERAWIGAPNRKKDGQKGWMHGKRAEFECILERHLRKELKKVFEQELWAQF